MSAIKTINPALVERLLNNIGTDLITKLVQDHQTAGIARRFGGVKKTLDILTFDNVKSLLRGWKKDGSALGEEFVYDKIRLSVGKFMMVLDVTPLEEQVDAFDSFLEGNGTIPNDLGNDKYGLDFMQWLISQTIAFMDAEMEDADWQAIQVTSGVNAADDAAMKHKFDGFRRQAATLAAAGKGTVVTTGVIDSTNAMAKVETFYRGFDKQLRRKGAIIFCSFNLFDDYKINYRAANQGRELGTTRLEGTNYEAAPIYLGGGKTMLVPVQGIGEDDVLIGCQPTDMAIGFDTLGDWNIQTRGFTVFAYFALKYGVTFLQQRPGYLVVNDRLIATEITPPRVN